MKACGTLTLGQVRANHVAYGCRNLRVIGKIAQILPEQVCVSLQRLPGLVERELCDLRNSVPALEEPAGRFVPQIMEGQVYNADHFARPCKSCADTLRLVRENDIPRSRLVCRDFPRLGRVLEASVVAVLLEGMLCIPNQAGVMTGLLSFQRNRQISVSRRAD